MAWLTCATALPAKCPEAPRLRRHRELEMARVMTMILTK